MLRIHRITQAIPHAIYPVMGNIIDTTYVSGILAKIKSYPQFKYEAMGLQSKKHFFMVKDWEDNQIFYPLDNDEEFMNYDYLLTSGNMGAEAQNNDDPISIFSDHVFVEFKKNPFSAPIYYDPSYGIKINPTATLAKYEDAAIEVVLAVSFFVIVPNAPDKVYMYVIQPNTPEEEQLKTTP